MNIIKKNNIINMTKFYLSEECDGNDAEGDGPLWV